MLLVSNLKKITKTNVKELSPMLSPRNFMVLRLTFKILIYFKLIFVFVYGVRKRSNLILMHVAIQFAQYH